MTIEEFADIIGTDLIIRRYSNQDNRYMAQFEDAETKENENDPYLTGGYGNGNSAGFAIRDYVEKIRGKLLVINAYGKRREFRVPKTLAAY